LWSEDTFITGLLRVAAKIRIYSMGAYFHWGDHGDYGRRLEICAAPVPSLSVQTLGSTANSSLPMSNEIKGKGDVKVTVLV
jgi:hypothetical protein